MRLPTFPIVRNELLRQGRRVDTYWTRVGLIGFVILPLAALTWAEWYYQDPLGIQPENMGRGLTIGAGILQFLVAFFAAPTFAASALTQEKEEGTLGLLMMADLRGWGIILAKFVAVMVRIAALMLCTAPFVGFAALFGAANVPAALALTLVLLVCSASVTAVGLYFSTVLRYSSMAASFTILAMFIVGTVIAYIDAELYPGGWTVNPLSRLAFASFTGTILPGQVLPTIQNTLAGCFVVTLLGALFLLLAVRELPRQIHRGVRRPRFLKKSLRRAGINFWRHDPLARLVTACVGSINMAGRNIFLRILAFAGVALLLAIPFFGWYVVMIVLFREIILSFERLKNGGTLDDFVLAPHTDVQIGRAFWWGHVGAAKIYGILLAAGVAWMLFIDNVPLGLVYIIAPIVTAQFFAVIAVACYSGTLGTRVGMLGGYIYLFVVFLGYTAPLAAWIWLQRTRWGISSWFDLAATDKYGELSIRVGGVLGISTYIVFNVMLFVALTALACWALGRRLRKVPLIDLQRQPATAQRREVFES